MPASFLKLAPILGAATEDVPCSAATLHARQVLRLPPS